MRETLNSPAKATAKSSFTPARTNLLQRKCACGGSPGVTGSCEECSDKQMSLQRSAAADHAAPLTVPAIVEDVLRSPGQPLDEKTRAFMEPRFGHDFSRVRVHSDNQAADSAQSVNALAYTVGHDVVFGAGQHAPDTPAGRGRLAHELTHVVQQERASNSSLDKLSVGESGDVYEQEAERMAESVEREEPARTPQSEDDSPEGEASEQGSNTTASPGSWKTEVIPNRIAFRATIRRAEAPELSGMRDKITPSGGGLINAPTPSALSEMDAEIGGAEEPAPEAAGEAPELQITPEIAEAQEGQTVSLPDITNPALAAMAETDAIASTVTYNPTITQTGPEPAPFGETLPYNFSLSGITVTAGTGTFTVAATLDNPITFQVRTSTGPSGQQNIESERSIWITSDNFASVAADLTPNMSDLTGRPPRRNFWSRDLTIIHERFHCTNGQTHAASGVTLAQNWLNTQTASNVAGVNALLAQVPTRVAATRRAAMTFPGREQRAYADGAPLYLARANAILTRGNAGLYGSAPGDYPTPPSNGPAYA